MDTSKTKAQIWAKGTTERADHRTKKKEETCNYRKISRKGFFKLQFLLLEKKTHQITLITDLY